MSVVARELLNHLLTRTGVAVDGSVIQITDAPPLLPTKLRAAETAAAVLGAQAALICQIWAMRTSRQQTAAIDLAGAALSLKSVFYQRQWRYRIMQTDQEYPTVAYYRTKDNRFIMLNGGYPRLRDGLLDLLDCPDNKEKIEAAVRKWNATELEDAAARNQLCAAVMRATDEWAALEQGQVLRGTHEVEVTRIGDADPMPFPDIGGDDPLTGLRPLSGIRVLDSTHVIAGPTCAKTLAEQGATVLHVYSPNRPHLPPFDMDTGHGKLSAFLNLKDSGDSDTLRHLLAEADVFSESYRTGVMEGFGLSPEKLAEIRPGIISVSCNCYGFDGPWKTRKGFEQLAQATTGIAVANGSRKQPQLAYDFYPNDYITGVLAAFGTLAALIRRATEGGSWRVRVSLCRTAMMMLDQGLNDQVAEVPEVPREILSRYMQERSTALGRLHYLGPVLRFSETPSYWDLPPAPLGAHPPRWPDWV